MEKTQVTKRNNSELDICKSDYTYDFLKWMIIDNINMYFNNNSEINEKYGGLAKKYVDMLKDNDKTFNELYQTLKEAKDIDKYLNNYDSMELVSSATKLLRYFVMKDAECIKKYFGLFIDQLATKYVATTLKNI